MKDIKKILLAIPIIGSIIVMFYKMSKKIGELNMELGLSADSMKDMLESSKQKEKTNEEVKNLSDSDIDKLL